jgi:hypothetical protein
LFVAASLCEQQCNRIKNPAMLVCFMIYMQDILHLVWFFYSYLVGGIFSGAERINL